MSVQWITRPTAAAWQALVYVAEPIAAEPSAAEPSAAEPSAATDTASLAAARQTWPQLVSLWQNSSTNSADKLPLWTLISELFATEISLASDRSAAPLSGTTTAQRRCAEFTACAAASGFPADRTATAAGSLLHDLALTYQSAQLEKELELRVRPLREQWDAFGPGLLYRVRKRSPMAGTPMVIAVPPLGNQGGGWPLLPSLRADSSLPADTGSNEKTGRDTTEIAPTGLVSKRSAPQVLIQAVLTNPHSAVPEVLRLAWLILVAEACRTNSSEAWAVAGRRSPADLIPLVLEAAEWVELARADESTTELARRVWCQPPFPVYNPPS